MGKTTKPIAGPSQRKYFRDLFRCDPGVSDEAAARLSETCCSEIAQIRVRLPLVVRRPLKAGGPSMALEAAKGAVRLNACGSNVAAGAAPTTVSMEAAVGSA